MRTLPPVWPDGYHLAGLRSLYAQQLARHANGLYPLDFVNQYGNSKAVPKMFISMTTGGTMFFFAIVTLLGLAWTWFFLPELAGKSLEAVDRVFDLPWYLIGRKGKQMTEHQGGAVENFGQEKAEVEMVDNITEAERKG